ncbi:MAG: argininosuccinate lyase, partial [Methanomicrobiales archaeon]|nr:argininosuccinate lyase [Methanomicrobiales archaeon]
RGVTPAVVERALDVAFSVRSRNHAGGPAPAATAAHAASRKKALAGDRVWIDTTTTRIESALAALVAGAKEELA